MTHTAVAIAKTIINGFERHIFLFDQITSSAKINFEQRQWQAVQNSAKQRTDFYDARIKETLAIIEQDFAINELDQDLWREVKTVYVKELLLHPKADLAESFYNSIFCHLFDREYFNNSFIFVESSKACTDNLQAKTIATRYQPDEQGLFDTIASILTQPNFSQPFRDLEADINLLIRRFLQQADKTRYPISQLIFEMLSSVFYRNKGAYIIGKVVSPGGDTPFIVALLNDENGNIYIDTLLTDSDQMAVVFGFARAYFFVDSHSPYALINFLQQLMPSKTKAELYSAIGYHKQGKTQFYRDFLNHLNESDDSLILAPGIKGMVMSVFTLPSYPYVFKIIKDKFSPSKQMSRQDVKNKYRLVKLHDRVGRMADTLEYSEVAFPKNRFSEDLLEELLTVAPSLIHFEQDLVIIRHMYIERRMTPLNLYLAQANEEQMDHALYGYGAAIKQLIAANIFPGDMLLKNFGVTRHGRVIFYDYDEITYMDEVNFRVKPEPKTEEQIYAAEPWYSVEPGDMFPEELATFALANPQYRQAFMKFHPELLQASYWQEKQENVAKGMIEDVFPYPNEMRFNHQKG